MRITVQYLDDVPPVDKSDILVMPMNGYYSVHGLPWFHNPNPDNDWARFIPSDHRVQVERSNYTDDYGLGIEDFTSQEW